MIHKKTLNNPLIKRKKNTGSTGVLKNSFVLPAVNLLIYLSTSIVIKPLPFLLKIQSHL